MRNTNSSNTNNDDFNTFGERIRQLRTQHLRITQKEFCEAIGIPQSTLSSYESGKIKPTIDVAIKISQTFSVSIDWLCGRDFGNKIKSLGDLMEVLFELYEIEEFTIDTDFRDYYDEKPDETDETKRSYSRMTIFTYDSYNNPKCRYGDEVKEIIEHAYQMSKAYRKYEKSKLTYEREKDFWIDYYKDIPLTKVDRSNLSESDLEKKRMEYWKNLFEKNGLKQGE